MEISKQKSILARFALILAGIIWGGSFIVMKDSVDIYTPAYLLAMRFVIGASVISAFYLPIYSKKRKKDSSLPTVKSHIRGGVAMGVCLFLAYYVQTWGLKYTTPGKNAFLTAVYCVMVPFLTWLVIRKKPDIYNYSAAIICFIGIGFVALDSGLALNIGDLLTLCGGFFYAAHLIVISKVSEKRDPIILTVIQFCTAAVLSFLVALISEPIPTVFTKSSVGGLLFLGIFATGVALLCQTVGQKYTPPTAASILLSLEAVFGVIFSLMLGYESMNIQLAIGFALIFIAVIISETKLSFIKRRSLEKGH